MSSSDTYAWALQEKNHQLEFENKLLKRNLKDLKENHRILESLFRTVKNDRDEILAKLTELGETR
jgi:uridine kinase